MADAIVKHPTQATGTDNHVPGQIGPDDYNEALEFSQGNDGEILTRRASSATGAAWEPAASGLPTGVATGSVLASAGVGVVPAWSATPALTDLTLTGQLKAANGSTAAPSIASAVNPASGLKFIAGSTPVIVNNGSDTAGFYNIGLQLPSGSSVQWSSGGINAGSDVFLLRDAANVLAQRNGTTTQSWRLYNTFTNASNYERLEIGTSGTNFFILATQAGTGTARGLRIGTTSNRTLILQAGGTDRWAVQDTSGAWLAFADNVYDIGASGANRPRDIFAAGGITTGATTLHTTSAALTNGAAAATGTLTNAPTAGNPTKWVPINDNGTTRYIPCW